MSSRAAGSRKRLQEPKPPKPPKSPKAVSSKDGKPLRNFFSRSKSAAPKLEEPHSHEVPPLPSPTPYQQLPQHGFHEATGSPRNMAVSRTETPRQIQRLEERSPMLSSSGYNSPRTRMGPYPSPEESIREVSQFSEYYNSPTLKKAVSASEMGQTPQIYLEATYQPPPPPRSRGPQTTSPMIGASEKSPHQPSLPLYSPPSPATSDGAPSPRPSPQPSFSAFNSLLLRPSSSDPPGYRTPPDYGHPSVQIAANLTPPHTRMQREGYDEVYPSPPPSEGPYFTNDASWRAGSEHRTPAFPDSAQPYPSIQSRAGGSVNSSSSSIVSGRRAVSPASSTPSSPATFVFPGSRSSARPKAVNGTPRIKFNKQGKSPATRNAPVSPVSPPRNLSALDSQSSQQASSSTSVDRGLITPSPTRPRKMSSATTATDTTTQTSATTSSTGSNRSNPGFVYPGGRSRAQPKMAPISMPSFKRKGGSSKRSTKSNGSANSDKANRTKFMGISLGKKKTRSETPESPMAFTLNVGTAESSIYEYDGAESNIGSTTSNGGPAGPEFEAYREQQMAPEVRLHERMARIKSRIGSYPLDPYDSILLDNDRHTGDLLNRLNGTGSPTFYDYGNHPPATALDLGCGQGHWVVDAAIAWKGHGTKVTGYDLVDISKVLMPWAVKQGVAENIRFVRGNFLKQRLPFPDNSFDLVRMSSLTLCITADAWIFVFQEVCRVLTVGGRLELIDDGIIFPYGKPPSSSTNVLGNTSGSQLNILPPRLDIQIPSSTISTFSIYSDGELRNPGLGSYEGDFGDEDEFYDLYRVKEEGESDADETATLNGDSERTSQLPYAQDTPDPRATPVPHTRNRFSSSNNSVRLKSWHRHAATCRDLEALFEHMLTHKFGIHMSPEEFVLDLMQDVFGHAREVRTMHLSLAPPDIGLDDDIPRGRPSDLNRSHDRYGSFGRHLPSPSSGRSAYSGRGASTPLSRSPGLILSPSTFIPMTHSELEIHASKHLRMLLSCKKFLVEHALEATEDEEIDEDSVLEALWEYEGFLRARFNHPPECHGRDKSPTPSTSDAASTRESIMSVSTDAQDAMWEYQTELRQRFAWPGDGTDNLPTGSRAQITPKVASFNSAQGGVLPPPQQQHQQQQRPESAGRSGSPASSIAPPYSRSELTHVRTFRIYEAIKLDESFGTSSFS
ncbi:hypothetical protein CC1G_05915 [Coprinopsis cinerea okayama7|uniref:Methyltransferase domain-containing protein n=1 Tax=Coprinopsis cinerea (strain Okayama-7 / 130 / ATCC MYA-4618 / FGSC 9003) TaxID=240176 RepID=A8NAG4_COPC7|nr:hypothetical protein CC1G_05915 [Coprinopsis cinerea okayama7\|eukprot:XP_001831816.2 hypothetical protein CC1G_05915 [Coprinopsis cinerea okayama7\